MEQGDLDKKLERPLDTTHIQQQKQTRDLYLKTMEDQGFTLDNVNEFERLMKDDASLKQWMDEQLESGREELAVKEDEIAMKEADARDFAKIIADSREAIDYWDTPAEDVIGDDAKAIKQMIKENPVLATKIMEDGAVNEMVQSRLEEGQKLIEEMRERFYKLEEKFMKTVNERVDSLELPQKLENQIDKLQQVLRIGESTATFNQTAIKELEDRMGAKDDEIAEHKDQISSLETERLSILRSKEEELVKQTADNKVTRRLICALAGVSISSDFTDSMIECQTRSTALYDASAGMGISQPLPMPQMVFEEDGADLDPTSHAIRVWSAIRSGRVSFPDSQALFNVDTIRSELAGVYPWIRDALTLAISQMEPVPWTVAIFKKMLTLLQGIAYLGYLVLAFRMPGEEVQALTRQTESFLVAENLLQPGSILLSVF
ncbi:MAG: hypothetical protein Q9226_008380, partial [Calogaya cf. arnoldii]